MSSAAELQEKIREKSRSSHDYLSSINEWVDEIDNKETIFNQNNQNINWMCSKEEKPIRNITNNDNLNENDTNEMRSDAEKLRGNELFGKGDLDGCISCYSNSIRFNDNNSAAFGNRALAYFKKNDYDRCISDCDKAISIDPSYVKAYFRRAMAYKSIGRLSDAGSDFKKLLSIEPGHSQATSELGNVQNEIEMNHKEKKKDEGKRTRIMIKEIDGNTSDAPPLILSSGATGASPSETVKPPPKKIAKSKDWNEEKAREILESAAGTPTPLPGKSPSSAFDFEAFWTSSRLEPEKRYHYLLSRCNPPSLFPRIFKDSMSAFVFEEVLQCLSSGGGKKTGEKPEELQFAFETLLNFTECARFSLNLLFLNTAQKEDLTALFNRCVEGNIGTKDERNKVRLKYNLSQQ